MFCSTFRKLCLVLCPCMLHTLNGSTNCVNAKS